MFNQLFESLAHLPVNKIRHEVVELVKAGTVTIVVSDTGSGKTLLLPPTIAETSNTPVAVNVPRKFLARNAAETVSKLAQLNLGQEVGFAVGKQGGDISLRSRNTSVLYRTYGYSLADGSIWTDPVVVLDEVHELAMDMSLCRAILYHRLGRGENVHVLEMSATLNAARQAAYWEPVAAVKVIEVDGVTFPCERRFRPNSTVEKEVKILLDEGRTGVIAFRPGQGEVHETAEAIRKLAGRDVEVAELYGELDSDARERAVAPPKGIAKVLVSTNVVESGANLPWVDCGVSCGTAKENSVRPETGAVFLGLIDLPQDRLKQQEGRVKRFRDGIFVLCSALDFDNRAKETTPEITRLPLTELVMHCAVAGIRAGDLVFDYPPEKEEIVRAETKLKRLGLIDNHCRLTEAGTWVSVLPVGPETGAMLWHARQTKVLGAALPLAAVIEVDGIRKSSRMPHGMNQTSDWLDAYHAFMLIDDMPDDDRRLGLFDAWRVSAKRFNAAKEMLKDLHQRLEGVETLSLLLADNTALRRCLVAGFAPSLLAVNNTDKSRPSFRLVARAKPTGYYLGNTTAVAKLPAYVLGQLRMIQPKDAPEKTFTVVQNVTIVTMEDLEAVNLLRPGLLGMDRDDKMLLFGEYPLELAVSGASVLPMTNTNFRPAKLGKPRKDLPIKKFRKHRR